ncbi:MAG: hypothetical protein Q9203_007038, partial [Teloschistes exilis]
LTEIRPYCKRWTWIHGNARRCDPPVLSVSRELSSDASKVLYNREFVIDVDCEHLSIGSRFHRFYEIVGHFPFQKARQVTIRIGVGTQCDMEDVEHIFDHLVHLFGLLFQNPNSVKKLELQSYQSHEDPGFRVVPCWCFEGICKPGVADKIDPYPSSLVKLGQLIKSVLPALAICGQISELLIHLPGELSQSVYLQEVSTFYQEMTITASTGRAGGSEGYQVMEARYQDLVQARSRHVAQMERDSENGYRLWLRRMCKKNPCKHAGPTEKQTRRGNRDSKCEGCMRWYRWLLECPECKLQIMRALHARAENYGQKDGVEEGVKQEHHWEGTGSLWPEAQGKARS